MSEKLDAESVLLDPLVSNVEFEHRRDCDVCTTARSDPKFNMHDPRTHTDYYLCSPACVKAQDRALKMERRLAVPTDWRASLRS